MASSSSSTHGNKEQYTTPRAYLRSIFRKAGSDAASTPTTAENTRSPSSLVYRPRPENSRRKIPLSSTAQIKAESLPESQLNIEMPLSSFHKFAALPPELRLCVWHWALRIPQIVAISSDEELRPIPTEELDDEDSYNLSSSTRAEREAWSMAG